MQPHLAALTITQQRGGGAGDAVAVKAMDLHALAEGSPRDRVLPLGDAMQIAQLDARERRDGIGRRHGADAGGRERGRHDVIAETKAAEVATAPKTPPCILIILSAAAWLPGSVAPVQSSSRTHS